MNQLDRNPQTDMKLGERIKFAARRLGDRKTAAAKMGISPDQLARYIRGENEPKIGAISNLAEAADVSLDWLIRGRGQADRSDALKQGDDVILTRVAQMLASRSKLIQMEPAQFAAILRDLYEFASKKRAAEGHLDNATLAEVVDYALLKSD